MISIVIIDKKGNRLIFCPESFDLYQKYSWRVSLPKKGFSQYLRRSTNKRTPLFHRELMKISSKNLVVDHKNGNSLDNRICNLRVCSPEENNFNRKPKGKSKYVGVSKHSDGRGYNTYVTKQGKRYSAGYFTDEVKAAKARDALAVSLFGEFARLNF